MSRSRSLLAVSLIGALVATVAMVFTGPIAGDQRPEVAQREIPLPHEVAPGMPGALLQEYAPFSPTLPDGKPMPGGWSVAVRALEPGTLDTVREREPIDLGYGGNTLVSPDGRFMAIASDYTGEVRIFDLETWTETGKLQAEKGIRVIAWSDDGRRLVAMRDFCFSPGSEGICPGGWLRDLWEIDVVSMALRHVGKFDFQSHNWHFDGQNRLVALALRTDICCGIGATEPPFVAVIDLTTGESAGEVALPELLMGQPKHWLGNTDLYASYSPAIVLSPDGATAYVFESVDQVVTSIELDELRIVARTDLQEPRTWFSKARDSITSWFVSTAEAKGGPSYRRSAAITLDGRFLVTSGSVSLPVEKPQWQGDSDQRPAGLLVIDTTTMQVVYREKTASDFTLSPDGRWAFATGSYFDREQLDSDGKGSEVALGLRIIDLVTLQETTHRWPDESIWIDAVSPDSRFVYVSVNVPPQESTRLGSDCISQCRRVSLVEVATGLVLYERVLSSNLRISSIASGP